MDIYTGGKIYRTFRKIEVCDLDQFVKKTLEQLEQDGMEVTREVTNYVKREAPHHLAERS